MPAASRPLLTARQAECLRLVPTAGGSKEIARILGIEPGTVDQHIKAATKALGETSRHVAARKFLALQAENASPKLDSQPLPLAEPVDLLPVRGTAAAGQPLGADWTLREQQSPFLVEPAPFDKGGFWPFVTKGRPTNRLTLWETLLSSWGLSLALSATTGVTVAGIVLLMRFLVDVSRNGG